MKRPNLGIRSKMFLMIACLIGLLFVVQIVFQSFFMEDFYLNRLSSGIEKDMDDVKDQISNISMNDITSVHEILDASRVLSEQPMHIVSTVNPNYTYSLLSSDISYIAFQPTSADNILTIPVEDDLIKYINENTDVLKSPVYVRGYYNESLNDIIPFELEIAQYVHSLEDDSLGFYDPTTETDMFDENDDEWNDTEEEWDKDWPYAELEGSIAYYQIGTIPNNDYAYSNDLLLGQIEELIYSGDIQRLEDDGIQYIELYDSYSNKNNLILYKRLDSNSSSSTKDAYYIFSIITYASIQESLGIYQEYNWITLVAGALLAFVLVFYFSGKMVKPIKDMERISSKMALLNFEERLDVYSTDELGQLSNSFNTLSDKLQSSIEDMRTLNAELAEEVDERTKQQLILKEFIANASHELKTPITIMKGLMDGVEDGIYDANSNEHKCSVQDEVSRMEKIVYDLLQVSRMERGAQHIDKSIFEPSDLVYSTFQRHKKYAHEKNIHFHFEFEDVFVKADAQLIESVIDNLISNAINYSGGGAKVYCKIHKFNNQVFLSIENTNAQIPATDLTQIFEPFYRVDKSHARRTGGSGLGLSIIKNILELHKSQFEITNTQNGVKFTFTLPIVESTVF